MGPQRGYGVVVARQLGLGEHGMDLVVADLVKERCLAPLSAAQPRHEMVQALPRMGRDGPVAKRANWNGFVLHTAPFAPFEVRAT